MEWFEILKNALYTGLALIGDLLTRTLFTLGEKNPNHPGRHILLSDFNSFPHLFDR